VPDIQNGFLKKGMVAPCRFP